MEEHLRQQILRKAKDLAKKTVNFDQLFSILMKNKIFNEYMKEEIFAAPRNERPELFYKYITTRGPNAFKELLNALIATGNDRLALNLQDGTNIRVFQNGSCSNEPPLDEQYPPDKPWVVTQAVERFDINSEEVYKMSSTPRGLALIINVYSFVNNTRQEREGSQKDVERLDSVFTQLGYKVIIEEDEEFTAEKMLRAVKRFAQRVEHYSCDSSVVFVMSHGDSHKAMTHTIDFCGWDSNTVNSDDIVNCLKGKNCEALRGKPKLFFFQACRGDKYNFALQKVDESTEVIKISSQLNNLHIESKTEKNEKYQNGWKIKESELNESMNGLDIVDLNEGASNNQSENDLMIDSNISADSLKLKQPTGEQNLNVKTVRNDADIFIGYSTTPGHLSMRDAQHGSWYIQILCQQLCKHAWNKDIVTILEYTDTAMKEKSHFGSVQSTEDFKNLSKKFYFQPGLNCDK